MRKRVNNLIQQSIVKIVLAVCMLCVSHTSKGEPVPAHVSNLLAFLQDSGAGSGSSTPAIEMGPIRNFLLSNDSIAQRLDSILTSSTSLQIDKLTASSFISRLALYKNENNTEVISGDLRRLGIPEAQIAVATKNLQDYLVGNAPITAVKPDDLAKVQSVFRKKLPADPNNPQQPPTGTTGNQQAGQTAGGAGQNNGQANNTTGGASAGATAGTTAGKPSREDIARQQAQDALLGAQLAAAQQQARGGGQGQGGGGGGKGGGQSAGGGGGGQGGSPADLGGGSKGGSDTLGEHSRKFAEDQKSKETKPDIANNSNFGNNNNSSNSTPPKDPFKKDDKEGGFKLPESKITDKKTVAKTGLGKTDPLSDPSGDGLEGPGVGYKSDLTLTGPSKVPGLAPKPDISALLGAAGGGAGGGGGGGDNPFAGSSIKSGGAPVGASFEGSPFNSNEGMGQGGPMAGPAFRKISPEAGAGTDGESVESSSGGTNDFRKKGTILDQIITMGPDEEERYKNLGVMAYVSRKERICTIPGRALLSNCPSTTYKSRRIISKEEDL